MKPILPKVNNTVQFDKNSRQIFTTPRTTVILLLANNVSNIGLAHNEKESSSTNVIPIAKSKNPGININIAENLNITGQDGATKDATNDNPATNNKYTKKNRNKPKIKVQLKDKCYKIKTKFKDEQNKLERIKYPCDKITENMLTIHEDSKFKNQTDPINELSQSDKSTIGLKCFKNIPLQVEPKDVEENLNNNVPSTKLNYNPQSYEKIRTASPPSYEAYMLNSPRYQSNAATLNCGDSQFIKYNYTEDLNNDENHYPPPYSHSNYMLSIDTSNIANYKDTSSNDELYHPLHYSDNNELIYSHSKYTLSSNNERVNTTTDNVSRDYSNFDYAESYNFYNDEPKDYSSNSEVNNMKKSGYDSIGYINSFTETATIIVNNSLKENETYEERRKHAQYILNNPGRCKSALKENFWIVEDEPLVKDGSLNFTIDDKANGKKEEISLKAKKKKIIKEYVCHVCGKIFKGRNSFSSHLNIHKGKTYPCQFCDRKFSHICSLKYHTRTHTNENPYTCQICSKSFKSLSNLNKHKFVHTDKKSYNCTICDKSFKTNFSLKTHAKYHFDQCLSCKICQVEFPSRKSLSNHIHKKHKNKNSFSCSECKKSYEYKCLLKQHMKVHSNECTYTCHICEAAFVWRSGLASHLKTHSFKLQCEHCPCKFISLKKLDKHRINHSNPTPHKCDKCNQQFKFAYLLNQHRARHKEELVCEICNIGFITKSKLKNHLKIHNTV